ncbi:Hypothetical protein MVR_LOCUS138 [uncultured virus]|nr:Hypothetical protein MVR_LOCUS138 [uncultured virus]
MSLAGASAILASSGVTVIDPDESTTFVTPSAQMQTSTKTQQTISLWDFLHLYTIGGMPIVDFLIVYVVLYVGNRFVLHYNQKIIIIATIALVILFNLVTSKVELSWLLAIVLVVCAVLLVWIDPHKS